MTTVTVGESVTAVTVGDQELVIRLGENTAAAAASAAAAAVSAAVFQDLTEMVPGDPVGYQPALGSGGGSFAAGTSGMVGTVVADGELHSLSLYVNTLNSGEFHLLVMSGTAPDFTVVQAIALTAAGTGAQTFTSADFGTVTVTAGQHIALSLDAGGPDMLNTAQTGNTLYYQFALTSGTATWFSAADLIVKARFVVATSTLLIEQANFGDDITSLKYLAADTPTQFDIFLIAGQSNAQGEGGGFNPLTIQSGVAKQYYSGSLTDLTADPVGNAAGNSAWIAFAQRYWALTGRGVIFVPRAVGGSGLICDIGFGNWSSGASLRSDAVTAVEAAQTAATSAGLRHQLAGVLWWQGEADAIRYDAAGTALDGGAMTAAKYVTGLQELHAYWQTEFDSPALPMIIARIGYPSTGDTTGFQTIAGALDTAARATRNMPMAFLAPQANVTTYHYTPAIYNQAGRDFATVAAAALAGADAAAGGAGSGTVTSVAMTVPTGFSVAGSPITSTGTLAVTYSAGYQGYTAAEAAKVALLSGTNTGDQDLSSYATTAAVAAGYQPLDGDLTAIAALATDTYGRSLLTLADAAALRTSINVADGATANAGTVTSVGGTGTVSGLTLTGTVTSSGNLTLGGTLSTTSASISDFNEAAQDAVGGILTDTSTINFTYDDGAGTVTADVIASAVKPTEVLAIACSDETTAITTGTGKVTFRMPYAFTLSAVRASVTTAPTGSTIIIDINEGGATILSTKLSIDASEKTSTTAATAAVISDTALADDAEITIDFDQVGSTIAGAGVKVYLIGSRT